MEKVIQNREGNWVINSEYLYHKLNNFYKKSGIKFCFGQDLSLPAFKPVTTSKEEAENIAEKYISNIIRDQGQADVMSKKKCLECDIFDKCFKTQLIDALRGKDVKF